ncbi:hypothetical protein WN944_016203 [Citrus x changshan-huyou]|uniref:Cytochrome P450 n=1 Tax=Citrus x changshan-huyou TaxID=2935761 RepID=A0AAP0MAG8_9ROSI
MAMIRCSSMHAWENANNRFGGLVFIDSIISLRTGFSIFETLRIHPPIPILLPRQSTQDVKINGYDIPEGTQVYINYATIAKDRASWDQADEFRPERFLVNPSINFLGKDLQFIPFGAGRRICPGIEFTMRVNELALASLLNKFDWSQPCEEREEAMDITESTGATKHKKSPLIALATPYSL